jgi:hypothetical protein
MRLSDGLKRWLSRALLALGVGALVWLISRFPLNQIEGACEQLGGWVLVTPLIGLGWFAAGAMVMWHLLQGAMPWRALFWNRIVGEGYNALVPAGGVGGEPVKLKQLGRYVDTHRAVVALINDRLLDNSSALMYSAACVGIGAWCLDVSPALKTTMMTYAIIGGLVGIALGLALVTNLTHRIGGRVAKWIGSTADAHALLPRPVLARALAWTIVGRVFGLGEFALLYRLLGLHVSIGELVFTGGAISAAGFIGGAIPQGMGVAEAATVGIFELLHFPGPAGVAFALARRGRQLLLSVLGVTLHLAFGRRVAAKEGAVTPAS